MSNQEKPQIRTLRDHLEHTLNETRFFRGSVPVASGGLKCYRYIPPTQDPEPIKNHIYIEPRKDDGGPTNITPAHVPTRQHLEDTVYVPD